LEENWFENLLMLAAETAVEAGKAAMYYFKNSQNQIRLKRNFTPVTLADKEANLIITERLMKSGINVISEEGKIPKYKIRKQWDKVWIVDPIDGTREFIGGGSDFTVNIALVVGKEVKMGVIYVPVSRELYYGIKGEGAFKQVLDLHRFSPENLLDKRHSISPKIDEDKIVIVVSRSNFNFKTKNFINKIEKKFGEIEIIRRSSSLKFCLVAEGKANIFPRLNTINEWDTAAGQAIAEASGCFVAGLRDGLPTLYNKKFMVSPKNIVAGSKKIIVNLSQI
jgi:3'(2'), 5'-bisphosphate nucleotidase